MNQSRAFHRLAAWTSLLCMGIAPDALAQQGGRGAAATPRWEVEIHVGGASRSVPSNGTAAAVPPSESFLTISERTTLSVPSWYFGDGSQLFNSFPSGVRLGTTIAPLDPALYTGMDARAGVVAGGRIARALTPRLGAEFTIDYATEASALSAGAQSAAEESRASFERAFTAFFTVPGSPWLFPVVTSTADVRERGNGQVLALGALLVRLRPGRWSPFVTAGGGVASTVGEAPHVSLTGRYAVQFATLAPFRETDRVNVRYELSRHIPILALGGGLTYEASRRTGIRVEVRALLGRTTATTIVRADGDIDQLLPPFAVALHPQTGHGVQFGNNAEITGRRSTLSSRSRDWETFRASGAVRQINATAGWYWKF